LFRRTKSDTAVEQVPDAEATGKKGRPTPSRREVEAANKARAKVPRTRKERAAAAKLARAESSSKTRQALRTGAERDLPARDKGPVRRFVRDYVDHRFSLIEILIPLMLVVIVIGWMGNSALATYLNLTLLCVFALIIVDLLRMRFRLRKELRERFPDTNAAGTTYYAIARSLQMRFMRLPKPQVKLGQELPEHYR
jgi:hypothetical protein